MASKRPTLAPNGPDWPQNGPHWPKMAQNGLKMAQKGKFSCFLKFWVLSGLRILLSYFWASPITAPQGKKSRQIFIFSTANGSKPPPTHFLSKSKLKKVYFWSKKFWTPKSTGGGNGRSIRGVSLRGGRSTGEGSDLRIWEGFGHYTKDCFRGFTSCDWL